MNIPSFKKKLNILKSITKASDRTGWMIDEVAFLIYALVKFYKPQLIIQVGHLWGKSAMFLLEALTDDFLINEQRVEEGTLSGDKKFLAFIKTQWPKGKRGKLISVDAFPYGDWKQGISYLKQEYGKNRFDYRVEKSSDFFKNQGKLIKKKYSGKAILGIVDGDHSYEACLSDIIGMSKLGAKYIIVDDLMWLPHIHKACQEFVRMHPTYTLSTFLVYNGLAVISKNK